MSRRTAYGQLEECDARALANVGVQIDGEGRSGAFLLRDFLPLCWFSEAEGLEVLAIGEALEKYEWLRENYFWNAVPPDLDDITLQCQLDSEVKGYFIRVQKGMRIRLPVQAGLYLAHGSISQYIHNVVVLEEDSELNLITGCCSMEGVEAGQHFAVSECYVGKNATFTHTMIHSWGPEVKVYPRSTTKVAEYGRYESNYVLLKPARIVENAPETVLEGRGASTRLLTLILGSDGSMIDIGGEVHLLADDTSAELVHRGVCTGGQIYQKGLLVGHARCRAHVDCAGMVIGAGTDGFIQSIPGLKGIHPDARMSHEASIGKIAPEQVEYLQSRGMEEREAISMIIRGFLDADIEVLGPELDLRIAEIAKLAGHGE